MIAHFPKEDRVRYGTNLESQFLNTISDFCKEPMQKSSTFDCLDFKGNTRYAELKVRTKDFHYSDSFIQSGGWVICAAKFLAAAEKVSEGKEVFFFYYWAKDESLWVLKFDPCFLNLFPLSVPKYHHDNQLHYFVPQSIWKFVGNLKIEGLEKPNVCLIQDD